MVVYDLPAMQCRHSPCAPRDLVQRSPKRFNRLAIDLSTAFNIAGRIPSKALILVSMDMEKTDAESEAKAIGNVEMLAAGYPVLHMNAPLTHDIVANKGRLYATHVEVNGFEY